MNKTEKVMVQRTAAQIFSHIFCAATSPAFFVKRLSLVDESISISSSWSESSSASEASDEAATAPQPTVPPPPAPADEPAPPEQPTPSSTPAPTTPSAPDTPPAPPPATKEALAAEDIVNNEQRPAINDAPVVSTTATEPMSYSQISSKCATPQKP